MLCRASGIIISTVYVVKSCKYDYTIYCMFELLLSFLCDTSAWGFFFLNYFCLVF